MSGKRIVLTAVLAIAVIGCGNGSGSADGGQRVTLEATPAAMQRAANSTIARTSKVDMTISMSVLGRPVHITATGAVDPANHRMTMSIDMRDVFPSLPASASSLFDEPMTMTVDGTSMYMHFAALANELPGGKEWIKIDIEKASGVDGLLGESGGGVGQDPSSIVQFLRGATEVTEVGREDIRGETTTHYNGTYTMRGALDAAPEANRNAVQEAFRNLRISDAALDTPIPFDAWIGDDGMVRRFDMTMDLTKFMPSSSPVPGSVATYSMEFHDFGSEVDIAIPNDDEVTDVTDLMSSQSKFSSVASSIN